MDSSKGRGKQKMEQISEDFTNMGLESAADGHWEVVPKKKSNTAGNRPSAQPITAPIRPMGPTATRGTGRGNFRPQSSNIRPFYPVNPVAPPPRAFHPLDSRPGASSTSSIKSYPVEDDDVDDDVSDAVDSDDDDEILSDDSGSDASALSFESRKKHKLLKGFFSDLDKSSVEEINSPNWRGHCPACQGRGPGAIAWYQGLQALMTHAKTKGSKRVKLHRELAELLDEEVRRSGASIIPAGEAFGKWEGVKGSLKDQEIVWPPMVVIMNTRFEQNEDDKWIGMGNPELLVDYFSAYGVNKASHSYGPQGHRGMSMLIFESSAIGYMKAKRLHKQFKQQGTDREAWDHRRVLFIAGGNRQLYGFMANKHDLEFFNQHAQGKSAKSRLKYEMRSYQETVLSQLNQMYEDNQKLTYYQDKAVKAEMHAKAMEQSFEVVSEDLRRKVEEVLILRQRSRLHHQQNKEEMDSQELFFKNQLKNMHDARDAKEDSFERLQQEELKKVKQSKTRREIEKFIKSKDKSMAKFEVERSNLMELYEEKSDGMKQRNLRMYYEEAIELEKQLDAQLNQLMHKYAPQKK